MKEFINKSQITIVTQFDMAKYKLLSKARLFDKFWVVGEIYDSTLRRNPK